MGKVTSSGRNIDGTDFLLNFLGLCLQRHLKGCIHKYLHFRCLQMVAAIDVLGNYLWNYFCFKIIVIKSNCKHPGVQWHSCCYSSRVFSISRKPADQIYNRCRPVACREGLFYISTGSTCHVSAQQRGKHTDLEKRQMGFLHVYNRGADYCTTPFCLSVFSLVFLFFFNFKQDLSNQLLNTIFLFSLLQPAPCLLAENE